MLPAILAEKRPTLPWRSFQERVPSEEEVGRWFVRAGALCVVTGRSSGNLEMIDFDLGGELFDRWAELVEARMPGLLGRLVIERSQSGGRHVIYRCQSLISKNTKLAQRIVEAPDASPVTICGKPYVPRFIEGRWVVTVTLIETRGEGGLFLCHPSPGYELLQGRLDELPVLTDDERDILLGTAWSLNGLPPSQASIPVAGNVSDRPGDNFNHRGDVREVLRQHGWSLAKPGDNEYWRRPGKTHGWSATLKAGVFYCFSANAPPFEMNQPYSPFAVYALLEHHGDYAAAALALRDEGFGQETPEATDVDISGIVGSLTREAGFEETEPLPDDPGLIPEELLRIPGFVSEVMDLCLKTAPYPNVAISFCGALALQAFLAGRKVRDPGDNRTNLYILGLAHSSAGKDWIRKLNAKILFEIGLLPCLGDRMASGEGIQETLDLHPAKLFQTDEIDGLLQSINRSKDARHEAMMNTLLTLYSASNSVFAMRPKAGKPNPGAIDQPCLVVFGTAIPNHYYDALSERMLTNGFFARQIVVEAGKRSKGQEPGTIVLSENVLRTAKWWADFRPGTGNLENWHPIPVAVEQSAEAKSLLVDVRNQADTEYAQAEDRGDPVGTTVWGRVSEQTRKLALVYAVSENHLAPQIGERAVQWASQFMLHQTRRMLYMAALHVSDSDFDGRCKRLLEALMAWQSAHDDPWMPYREISRLFRWSRREHDEVRQALVDQERIAVDTRTTGGRPRVVYRALVRRKDANAE